MFDQIDQLAKEIDGDDDVRNFFVLCCLEFVSSIPISVLVEILHNVFIITFTVFHVSSFMKVTISTVDTTSSDYRVAARIVNVHSKQRYTSLTSLNRPNIFENRGSCDVRKVSGDTRKPVDPVWARKQENGPSARDLELLSVPDPLVTLNFRLDRSTGKGVGSNGWDAESSSSRGNGMLGGAFIGGAGTGTGAGRGKGTDTGAGTGRGTGTATGTGAVDGTGVQGNHQSNAYLGGLMSSVDPVTLIPKFSIDIR